MTSIGSQPPTSSSKNPAELFGYRVLECVGTGAASLIYRVVRPDTQKIYCLKHVIRKTDRDDRFIEQLENEHDIARRVTHRGLRRSLEFKINRTLLRVTVDAAMVLEFFEGKTLSEAPTRNLLETLDCFSQVAEALVALHQMGYVHCDLKPSNIIRNSVGDVKVIDLGQACPVGTVKKRVQGTPDYIAPEQVKCLAVSPKTDVYNFGATMYWDLTGQNLPTLFTVTKGENSFLVDSQISSPRELNATIPQQLSDLVMECVRVHPPKRPELPDILRRLQIIDHVLRRPEKAAAPALQPVEPPLMEPPMSNFGTQLERAMATVRQQNANLQQLRQAVQERDVKLAAFQKEKESALQTIQTECAEKEAELADLRKDLATLKGIMESQTKQLDAIKRVLGDVPDDDDVRVLAEFNKMFPTQQSTPNGKPGVVISKVKETRTATS